MGVSSCSLDIQRDKTKIKDSRLEMSPFVTPVHVRESLSH